MGRKIPGKKHRGVKDPLEQLERRNASKEFNVPPLNPDEQEIPKRVLEIKKLKEMSLKIKDRKRRNKKDKKKLMRIKLMDNHDHTLPGMRKQDKKFPDLVQRVGETEESFLRRVMETADDIISETNIEGKFNVKVSSNESRNMQDVKKNDIDSDEELCFSKKRKKKIEVTKNKNVFNKGETSKKKLNYQQRQKLKKKSKLEAKKEEDIIFQIKKDHVKFGEIVHKPPQLSSRPKGANKIQNNPGKKDLLLKNIMKSDFDQKNASVLIPPSMAAKKRMERQRLQAVEAYRELKKRRCKIQG